MGLLKVLFLCAVGAGTAYCSCADTGPETDSHCSEQKMGLFTGLALGAVGAGLSVAAAPVVLGMIGFTSAGIAASTLAASMMSTAAIANGGGVAAGGVVAVLQSAAVTGIPAAASAAVTAVGAVGGAAISLIV